MVTRREFVKYTGLAGVGLVLTRNGLAATALDASVSLSDPAIQPLFTEYAPNALHPSFKYAPYPSRHPHRFQHGVFLQPGSQQTGLVHPKSGRRLTTPIWGYGDDRGPTWPGRTFEVTSGTAPAPGAPSDIIKVRWTNELYVSDHLVPVDTNLHWCFSLPGYTRYSIRRDGVPIITHLHGGHSDFQYDGNPEFFYTPDGDITGPQWDYVNGGFTRVFEYDNTVPAGTLWYHDHALGITRLNVYAGLAGFYIVRDGDDTGMAGNSLDLPAYPYELAYAIQDRMFTASGELFYPAYPGDPSYADFIDGEGAILPRDLFRRGGPTALAEFFGDHMVVNGKIWPKEDVEPRNYRMRLLNGTDSRFFALEFWEVPAGARDFEDADGPITFTVVGSDQGLASAPTPVTRLVFEPGSRYDVVVNFAPHDGKRVIMRNLATDEPFGGIIPDADDLRPFEFMDRVMAFDVVLDPSNVADVTPTFSGPPYGPPDWSAGDVNRTRKVALFEGTDEFGRLQPLLGTAEPATDWEGTDIDWPDTEKYSVAGLSGPMEGSIAWHSPTTENPKLGDVEEWEIWNVTGDAHPIHLHLVNFKVVGRQEIKWDSGWNEEEGELDGPLGDDGIYVVPQKTVQHNSDPSKYPETYGNGSRIVFPTDPDDAYGDEVPAAELTAYVENTPKDMVTALPGQITRIRAKFDKPGRYVWHCHILSHEDHEMMRVLQVTSGPGGGQ